MIDSLAFFFFFFFKRSEHVRDADGQLAVHGGAVQHQVSLQQDDEERDERDTGALVQERRGPAAQAAQPGSREAHLAQGGHGAPVAQRGLLRRPQALPVPESAHRRAGQRHHHALHEHQHGLWPHRDHGEHQGQQAEQLPRHLLSPPLQGQVHALQNRSQKGKLHSQIVFAPPPILASLFL
jgi:hypothetical protein